MNKTGKKARYCYDACTVADMIHDTMPSWKSLDEWFMWPPDVFLLTSLIFKRTGCYRYVVNEKGWQFQEQKWSLKGWQSDIDEYARQWMGQINEALINPRELEFSPFIRSLIDELKWLIRKVTVQDLKVLEKVNAKLLCQKIIMAHALADQACAGIGLISNLPPSCALAHYLANLLLVTRGTLSGVPKFHGIVLPKMRTPQTGISARSLSIHLTYHITEVEVMWRTMPWANIEENTLNILAIPWPDTVNESCFTANHETFEPVRYFSYKQAEGLASQLDRVIDLIEKIDKGIGRVHVLAFPELALQESEYDQLLFKLMLARVGDRIRHTPMVITGVRREEGNEVRLAAYFAGKWYNMSQSKHHRWKLDRNQIRQYSLEGRLATARGWYEDIHILQRRLTFMVPTGWLALCPLICEDLARLEPVSEIIRGVGPSLMVALLMDGPQLKERWPARYASVFADDPGTAVLTLTSEGMIKRSKPIQDGMLTLKSEDVAETDSINRNVALWKDYIRGWYPVELTKNHEAVLLTLSADLIEECTADGRSDNGFASVFKLEGGRQFSFNGETGDIQKTTEAEENKLQQKLKENWKGDWLDIRELSAVTFALDTLLTLKGEHYEIIQKWLLTSIEEEAVGGLRESCTNRQLADLITLLGIAHKRPDDSGISTFSGKWPTESLLLAVAELESWKEVLKKKDVDRFEYWNLLYKEAYERLTSHIGKQQSGTSTIKQIEVKLGSGNKEHRINRAIPLSILFALHARLERLKRWKNGSFPTVEAANLMSNIEKTIQEYAF